MCLVTVIRAGDVLFHMPLWKTPYLRQTMTAERVLLLLQCLNFVNNFLVIKGPQFVPDQNVFDSIVNKFSTVHTPAVYTPAPYTQKNSVYKKLPTSEANILSFHWGSATRETPLPEQRNRCSSKITWLT